MVQTLAVAAPAGLAPSLAGLAVSLAVLVLILFRQLAARPLRTRLYLPIILIVAGLGGQSAGLSGHPLSAFQVTVLVVVLAADAVGLGAVRAYTIRLWRVDGQIMRRGTRLTAGLWLFGLAVHMIVDALAHIGSGNQLLYLGLTWATQLLVLRSRTGGGQPGRRVPELPATWPSEGHPGLRIHDRG